MTLETFYSILRDAVKYYPPGNDWQTLQAFRVLQHDEAIEMVQDNLGATMCDIDSPYFYSRPWEEAGRNFSLITGGFPLLTAFEQSAVSVGLFTNATAYNPVIGISVWDKYVEKKNSSCEGPENRSINVIWKDTMQMLLTVADYLNNVWYFEIDGGEKSGWYNAKMIERLQETGNVSADVVKKLPLAQRIVKGSQNTQFFRSVLQAEKIAGTTMQITLSAAFCDRPEYTFESQQNSLIKLNTSCC
jgi:hypothetical protein